MERLHVCHCYAPSSLTMFRQKRIELVGERLNVFPAKRRGTTGNHTAVPKFIQKIAHSQQLFYVRFRIELASWVNRISALLNDTVCKRYISSNNQVALLNHRNDTIICHIKTSRYRNPRNVHRLRNLQMLVRDQNQRNTNALNCPEQDIHYHTGKCISIDKYLHFTPSRILIPITLISSQVLDR